MTNCPDCKEFVCFECGTCGCRQESEWISVKDRLPEEGTPVLTYSADGFMVDYTILFDEIDQPYVWARQLVDDYLKVTHWMPLPTPPIDKDSASYFMTQMTQEEFTERSKSKSPLRADFEFNRIHKKD